MPYKFSAANKILEIFGFLFKCDLGKCDFWSDSQYGFSSTGSAADLSKLKSDRMAEDLRFGATQPAALNISKTFDRVWH